MRYDDRHGRFSSTPHRARPGAPRRFAPEPLDIHITRRRGVPLPRERRAPPGGAPQYTGPGEAGRYGHAPVPYGPEHTYDYHLGDRYGRGPDYWVGEERVRRTQPARRRGPHRRWPRRPRW